MGCSLTRKSSAVCRLDWSASNITWNIVRFRAVEPEREDIIREVAAGQSIMAAALDGPLRRGFEVIGRYRTAERMLTRRLRPLIGKPGQSSAPIGKLLNHHANECARRLAVHADLHAATHEISIDKKALVEAFPSSFLGMMIADPASLLVHRGNRSDIYFQHLATEKVLHSLVEHCLPNRQISRDITSVINHDDRAALICALTALCVVKEDFVAVGDDDGWIILPPQRFIQPKQWELLNNNAQEEVSALYISGQGKL